MNKVLTEQSFISFSLLSYTKISKNILIFVQTLVVKFNLVIFTYLRLKDCCFTSKTMLDEVHSFKWSHEIKIQNVYFFPMDACLQGKSVSWTRIEIGQKGWVPWARKVDA